MRTKWWGRSIAANTTKATGERMRVRGGKRGGGPDAWWGEEREEVGGKESKERRDERRGPAGLTNVN